MKFLTRKEKSLITSIRLNELLNAEEKTNKIAQVKSNARLRSDGYGKNVKVFLHALAGFKNEAIASKFNL